MNSDQKRIKNQTSNTIRKYREARFLICNSCLWCASYLSNNYFYKCPTCRSENIELIPIAKTEAYRVGITGNGISMEFWNL
jgi:hypothetical protein